MKTKKHFFLLIFVLLLFLLIYFRNNLLFLANNSNITKMNVEFHMVTGVEWEIKKPNRELRKFLSSRYTKNFGIHSHFPIVLENEPKTYFKKHYAIYTKFIVYGYFLDSLADYSITDEGLIPIFRVTKYKTLKWQ